MRLLNWLLASFLAASPALAAEPAAISEAETVMFMTNHLAGVKAPSTLRYAIHHGGSMEKAFDDTAEVVISPGKGQDAKSVSARFLSGERRLELPAVESAEGNPVLLYFLERDIREMKRLTGAKNQNYFQKRIRIALADAAEVKTVTIKLDGREVQARQIRISPYLDDPNKDKFEKYTGKYYVFTLSEAVPGQLYRAESVIPDKEGANRPPLVEEVLSYAGSASDGAKKK
ncbi:MAG TPA: hypothetical protein VF859_14305 [Burkholderiales bacterium]